MPIFRARAPVRFCDLGGWTDIRIVPHGYVLNLAATLYTHVTVETVSGDGVWLRSHDTDEEIHVHAYDIEREVPAGKTITVSFKATITGIVEVEFHGSGEQIAELTIEPR